LVILVLMNLPSISQSVIINKDSLVIISKPTAVEIVKDLERGDLCAEVLSKTNEKLIAISSKVIVKDSIIKYYKLNEKTFLDDMLSYEKKDSVRVEEIELQKSIASTYKRQRNLVGGVGILAILYGMYISLIKR